MRSSDANAQDGAIALCPADSIAEGEKLVVEAKGRSLGVFNVNGTYRAYLNVCPHQKAPVCLGPVSGTNIPSKPGEYEYSLEGRVLKCPWHGWEFNLDTGESLLNREKGRLAAYEVWVQDGNVMTSMRRIKPREGVKP